MALFAGSKLHVANSSKKRKDPFCVEAAGCIPRNNNVGFIKDENCT